MFIRVNLACDLITCLLKRDYSSVLSEYFRSFFAKTFIKLKLSRCSLRYVYRIVCELHYKPFYRRQPKNIPEKKVKQTHSMPSFRFVNCRQTNVAALLSARDKRPNSGNGRQTNTRRIRRERRRSRLCTVVQLCCFIRLSVTLAIRTNS